MSGSAPGADPAEVRLATLLFGKPRTTLEGGKDVPFVEVEQAISKVAAPSNGVIDAHELKGILDWHAVKCTGNDFNAICRLSRAKGGDPTKIDVNNVLDRIKKIHAGTFRVFGVGGGSTC